MAADYRKRARFHYSLPFCRKFALLDAPKNPRLTFYKMSPFVESFRLKFSQAAFSPR
jgi:hypothetical protein